MCNIEFWSFMWKLALRKFFKQFQLQKESLSDVELNSASAKLVGVSKNVAKNIIVLFSNLAVHVEIFSLAF